MKKTFLLLTLLITMTGIAVAAPFAADAITACEQSSKVDGAVQRLARDGYTVQDVIPNAYRYLEQPTGNYVWGTVTTMLSRCQGSGDVCRAIDYAKVEAEVQYLDGRGYRVTKVTTTLWTVES